MPRRNRTVQHDRFQMAPSCINKRKFRNRIDAERQIELQTLEQPSLDLEVYQCEQCGNWHLTRSKSRR